ncbi:alpha/beta-hydrolase [Neocallimastix californiae]|jgi:acetyl esterase/lipase|uniref:Alpha/beta-hydrolase n=1 Tax=Neocallimastix californiae TaxID=1754190 RepID=A0A1Y2AQW3_9FUNG|nr:alpha/beta-hydrolase [Neocallimastix californiae]|eukprot:ORY24345.1 alpha/beta-hydrolase [Neocallimastix californiae]
MNIIKRRLLNHFIKDIHSLKDLENPDFGEGLKRLKNKIKKFSTPKEEIKQQMDVELCKINEYIYYKVQDKNNKNNSKKVLYIHGGAFFLEAIDKHWKFCLRLSKVTGCEIIFPFYPLVPESNSENSHNMLLSVYKELISNNKPEDITIMGDSAGGTIALTLSMLARDKGLPVPNEIVLITPVFSIGKIDEEENKRLEEIKKHDYYINEFPIEKIKELWCGNLDVNDYRVNALNGSLKGLPRITIFSGTYDIMNIPTRKLVSKLKKEGHPYYYEEKEGGVHIYVVSKNSKKELELIVSRVMGE